MKKKVVEEMVKPRTLLVSGPEGQFRITIPGTAHVTFGPTIPYERKSPGYAPSRPDGYSLRVYETVKKDSLIAVFCDVSQFRDLSIPHAKLVIREAGKSVWKSDEEGYKVEQEIKRDKTFVDDLKLLEQGE